MSAELLHYELIRGLLNEGRCPSIASLTEALGGDVAALETAMRELDAIHGVVLHPHCCEPWILHPFSLTPTLNWVTNGVRSWWAPCLWCACGVAALAGGEVRIHTRCGAEAEPLVIEFKDGVPVSHPDLVVHFAIPPARAWQNVHQHCALVLPFHSAADVADWCVRYGVPMGQAVPLEQTARLARRWYGTHANPDWHKWSVVEAQAIFEECGLTGEFWRLAPREGKF